MNTPKKTILSIAIIILFIRTAYSLNPSISEKEFKFFYNSDVTVVASKKVITSSF
tara:strand:- start:156 stop:320 length:165 start_codon:yes stop_codon:yes gene_type:complete